MKLASLPYDVETLLAIWQKYGPIVDGVDFSKQRRALREWGGSLPPKAKATPVSTAITALECIKLAVKLVSDYGGQDYKNTVGKIRWWDSFVEDFKGLIDSGVEIGAWYNPWDKTLKVGLIKNRPPEVANYYLRLKPPKKGQTVAWPLDMLRANLQGILTHLSVTSNGVEAIARTVFHAALLQLAIPKQDRLCECGCGRPIPRGRQSYATDACRKRAWRQREKEKGVVM